MAFQKNYRLTAAAAAILCAAFFQPGCTGHRSSDSNVFRYNESNGISTLDPAFARDLEIMWATNQLFDGLVELDSALRVVPSIASRWEISADGLVYTFHLRDSVFFHPSPHFSDSLNRRVVARDFVYSFSRIIDPAVASPGAWIFSAVDASKFSKDFTEPGAEINNCAGFEAVNDSTLKIYLVKPFAPFLGILATQYANVVPREVVEFFGSDFRSHPIGTGPFRFAFWYENVALVFHRHNRFWQRDESGRQLPYLDAVKIDFARDMSVEYQGLLQGQYDFMSGIHAAYKDELLDQQGNLLGGFTDIYYQKTPFIKTDYLGIVVAGNMDVARNSPLLDARVRRAMRHAINLEEMVEHLRNNSVIAANGGFLPPALSGKQTAQANIPEAIDPSMQTSNAVAGNNSEGHSPAPATIPAGRYNPDLSKKLLAEAGYPLGEGLPEIEMATTPDYTDLLEYMQHELQKVGIRIKVTIMQGAAFREKTAQAQIAVFRKSWLADYAHAQNFLSLFHSGNFSPGGPNYTHFSNPEFDRLYEDTFFNMPATDDDRQRFESERIEKMDSIINIECPVIPLYYDQVSHFIRKEVSGFETNGINMLDLKRVRKS